MDFYAPFYLSWVAKSCKEGLITTCHTFGLGSQTTHCFQNTPEMLGSPRELPGCTDEKETFEEQTWLLGFRAWVTHDDDDGLLPLPLCMQCFWHVTHPTLVVLVTLQWFCKQTSNFYELELSFISVLLKGFIVFQGHVCFFL